MEIRFAENVLTQRDDVYNFLSEKQRTYKRSFGERVFISILNFLGLSSAIGCYVLKTRPLSKGPADFRTDLD